MSMKFALAVDGAKRKREYAHYLMRASRRDDFYRRFGLTNQLAEEARHQMQEAIRFIWQAKDIRAQERHAQAMRDLWGSYDGDGI
jgi:hypothetical protein